MRCRFLLLMAFLLVAALPALSQPWAFELWHEGRIVLDKGDTLKGFVKYDLEQDVVQYMVADEKAEIFTARKVLFFEIFDETVRKYRQFFTLPYGTDGGYKTPVFFELLEEGPLTLLAKEFLEYKTYSSAYTVGSISRVVLSNRYFFLHEDGTIRQFRGKKNDLLDMMGKHSKLVDKFIKSNRLQLEDKYDFARIIEYYNSLSGT